MARCKIGVLGFVHHLECTGLAILTLRSGHLTAGLDLSVSYALPELLSHSSKLVVRMTVEELETEHCLSEVLEYSRLTPEGTEVMESPDHLLCKLQGRDHLQELLYSSQT